MQRYFVTKDSIADGIVTITGGDVHHIVRVMRMEQGDEIICSDNDKRTYRCRISSLHNEAIQATILEEYGQKSELPVAVTIAQGLPKGDKLEFITQKSTELGASCVLPFSARRSVPKWDEKKAGKKIERLNKIAKEAAEQAHRDRIPKVEKLHSFQELLGRMKDYQHCIVAYEEVARQGEPSLLAKALARVQRKQSLLVIIGPEGGLTPEEVEKLKEEGAALCGLGPRILRTETAPMYVLSAISYYFE